MDIDDLVSRLQDHPVVVALAGALISTAFGAAFPRAARRLRWRNRLSLRGHLVWIAIWTAIGFAARGARAALKAWFENYERRLDDFRRRHGREPTEEESRELLRARAGAPQTSSR